MTKIKIIFISNKNKENFTSGWAPSGLTDTVATRSTHSWIASVICGTTETKQNNINKQSFQTEILTNNFLNGLT